MGAVPDAPGPQHDKNPLSRFFLNPNRRPDEVPPPSTDVPRPDFDVLVVYPTSRPIPAEERRDGWLYAAVNEVERGHEMPEEEAEPRMKRGEFDSPTGEALPAPHDSLGVAAKFTSPSTNAFVIILYPGVYTLASIGIGSVPRRHIEVIGAGNNPGEVELVDSEWPVPGNYTEMGSSSLSPFDIFGKFDDLPISTKMPSSYFFLRLANVTLRGCIIDRELVEVTPRYDGMELLVEIDGCVLDQHANGTTAIAVTRGSGLSLKHTTIRSRGMGVTVSKGLLVMLNCEVTQCCRRLICYNDCTEPELRQYAAIELRRGARCRMYSNHMHDNARHSILMKAERLSAMVPDSALAHLVELMYQTEAKKKRMMAQVADDGAEPVLLRTGDLIEPSAICTPLCCADGGACMDPEKAAEWRARPKTCAQCGVPATPEKKLMKCARCQRVYYCSAECQKKHWKAVHKRECRKKQFKRWIQGTSPSLFPICPSTSTSQCDS